MERRRRSRRRRLDVCIYVHYILWYARSQTTTGRKIFSSPFDPGLPLLTWQSLYVFCHTFFSLSLSPHPVFFAFGPQGQAHSGTTWPPAGEGKYAPELRSSAGTDRCRHLFAAAPSTARRKLKGAATWGEMLFWRPRRIKFWAPSRRRSCCIVGRSFLI